jgi:hypothetical protein
MIHIGRDHNGVKAMHERKAGNPDLQPPHMLLMEMACGHWMSRIAYVAAELALADHLAEGPRDAADLAAATATHAPSLYRLLRALASLGIFAENDRHEFSLTPIGDALRIDAPGSARATILTIASDWWFSGFGQLRYAVETGRSGLEKTLGMPLFDWLAQNPDQSSLFSETMVGVHGMESAAVAASYDFSRFATIVDVGGAAGHLLTTILGHHAEPRGILYDLPHVVRDAPRLIETRGMSGRVTIEKGSFFDRVPHGGDAYLLSHIIHDWSEDQCIAILRHCRQAMRSDSRLLLIEMVLPDDNAPHPGQILDLMMLVGTGGQERTESDYRTLLGKAGCQLTGVIPTGSPVSIVEAAFL